MVRRRCAFLAHLTDERGLGPEGLRGYIATLEYLHGEVLGRAEATAWIPWPKKPKRLPTILTQDEVARLILFAGSPRTRAMIMAGYGAGLRVSDVRHLRAQDVDSARGLLWVRNGKGAKDPAGTATAPAARPSPGIAGWTSAWSACCPSTTFTSSSPCPPS